MLTNMMAIGLVENVVIRSKKQSQIRLTSNSRSYSL